MKRNLCIICIIFLAVLYSSCNSGGNNTVHENGVKESLSIEQVDVDQFMLEEGLKVISAEDKSQRYHEYIENYLKETLVAIEGIADAKVSVSSEKESFHVMVELQFEEAIKDKASMLKELQESLEKFFPEGTDIEFNEYEDEKNRLTTATPRSKKCGHFY